MQPSSVRWFQPGRDSGRNEGKHDAFGKYVFSGGKGNRCGAENICIPGSSNEQHIIEDYDVWDFELTEEEMAQMNALERDDRFADY